MIYYGCPKCGTAMGSPEGMAGQVEDCPGCGEPVIVPRPASATGQPGASPDFRMPTMGPGSAGSPPRWQDGRPPTRRARLPARNGTWVVAIVLFALGCISLIIDLVLKALYLQEPIGPDPWVENRLPFIGFASLCMGALLWELWRHGISV